MKELTIQQKAEAYDEALKIARNILDSTDDNYVCTYLTKEDIKEMYSRFFPQLKEEESEDEKIKKSLIDYFSDFHLQTFAGLDPKKVLAWIKKQGSDELAWNEEDNRIRKAIIDNIQAICEEGYFVGNISSDKLIDWLKSLKPQKRWKPSDEQMHYLSWIANVKLGDSVVEQEVSKHLNELYQDLKKLREE